MSKKEDRHKGCVYRDFCTKQDKWCPYLQEYEYTEYYPKKRRRR